MFHAMDEGYKRGVAVWHRRAGKDKSLINLAVKKAYERVGAYYYFFPSYTQGKKILWNGIDKDGFKFLNHIPEQLRARTNQAEMLIELSNGSIFQIVGSDNIDSVVGTNPVGCVFSEYALQDPRGFDFVRPILRENGGWAMFNFTPRGHNHGYDLYVMAKNNPDWFCEILTVKDTLKPDGTQYITDADIESERRDGMGEELILQEFFCSFEAAIPGAYYGTEMRLARDEGRVCKVDFQPEFTVYTAWDLGVSDSTAIWFYQIIGREIHVIDYYENAGEGLGHYINYLFDKVGIEKGYKYGEFNAPHDIKAREKSTGKSLLETAWREHQVRFNVVPSVGLESGIETVRRVLKRCWFDETRCERGINCLTSYHKDWDSKGRVWRLSPVHDWASHGADSFRYLALSVGEEGRMISNDDLEAATRTRFSRKAA